jgi:hypothetical protein
MGLVILAVGVGALLQALDVTVGAWKVVLPGALIAVGLGLVVAGMRSERGQGGLIAIGIVLTVLLAAGTAVDIPFEGGVGNRVARPETFAGLRSEYTLSVGQQTIDLTALPLPADRARSVRARVGIGQLVVIVPRGLLVDVRAHAGIGQVTVFGRENGGFSVDEGYHPFVPPGAAFLSLDLSVGMGQVDVHYG